MKVIVKKEYDTAEVVEKLEKVLRKSMTDKAQVIIDKDDIKDIINILKYFDNDFERVKSETIREVEKLKNINEQMKALEESKINQNRSIICKCFWCYTIGESWERECSECKYIKSCMYETNKKKVSGNE